MVRKVLVRDPDAVGLQQSFADEAAGLTVDNTVDPPVEVTSIVAPGATIVGDEATLGKWTATGAADETVDLSTSVTASGGSGVARVNRTAIGTDNVASAEANTTVTSVGEALANVTVNATGGVQDANATTTATAGAGNADASREAQATGAGSGDAFASTSASSADGNAEAKTTVTATTSGAADSTISTSTADGGAISNTYADASADGDATIEQLASVAGTGTATASLNASRGVAVAGMTALADATSARMAFNGATPIAKPTGVAVTAEAIHAALVSLGLIAA